MDSDFMAKVLVLQQKFAILQQNLLLNEKRSQFLKISNFAKIIHDFRTKVLIL